MGKSQTNSATGMATQNNLRFQQQGDKTQSMLWGQLPGAQQQAQDTYKTASGAYGSDLGGTGAYDPDAYGAQTNTNQENQKTGGYNAQSLADLQTQQKSNVQTGGYDPSKMSQLQTGYGNLTSNGMGGIDPTQAGKVRSGYERLADTGGIDNNTADAMRRQTASSVQSVYNTAGQNLARQGAAQGTTPGGETAEMARHVAQDAATATTGVNAQIGQERQAGTIAGLGGMSNFEQGVAGAQREALAGQSNLANSEASNRIAATGQQGQTLANQAQGTLNASQAQQELITGAAQQKIAAAGGLTQLYNSSPGYVNSLVQQIMQSQAQTGQLTTEQAQIMQELSKNPGMAQTILSNIAALGGAAGGVMTGIGNLP